MNTAIVTKLDLLAATADGSGPLAEAADDEPVFVLRGADFESQEALCRYIAVAHTRYAAHSRLDHDRAVLDAMKRWFDAHNPLPRVFRDAPPGIARVAARVGSGVRKWKR